jgi:signal peptidase II
VRGLQERRPLVPAVAVIRAGRARALLIPVVAALVVAADQATKTWAENHARSPGRHLFGSVQLILTYNAGAAFSLGRGVTPVVEAVVIGLVVWLLAVSRRAMRAASPAASVALGLLLGGAVGNLADRVFRHHGGAVVDFIQAASWWPVFNVADACIVVGVAMVILVYPRRPAPVG